MKRRGIYIFTLIFFIIIAGLWLDNRTAYAETIKKVYDNEIISVSGDGKLYIGKKIERIYEDAFYNEGGKAPLITEVEVAPGNKYFIAEDGVLYSKDKKQLIYYPSAKKGESFTVSGNIKVISGYAFFNNQNLRKVVISDNVTDIGESAFADSNIETVSVPGKAVIGIGLFSGCVKLEDIYWDCAEVIPSDMFFGCKSLKTFKVPDIVQSIEKGAFTGCQELDIKIGKNVDSIGYGVFEGAVKSFSVDPNNKSFMSADGVLYSKDEKELIAYPYSKDGAYVMPEKLEEFDKNIFQGNRGLTSLTLNNNIKEFDLSIIYGCNNLEKLRLSASTEKVNINEYDYEKKVLLENLKEIEVPEENKYFRGYSGALYSADYRKLYYILATGRQGITIHKKCTQILNIYGENKIQVIEVEDGNQKFSSYEGVLYNKDMTSIVLFPGLMETYNVPASVKDISVIGKKFDYDEEDDGYDRYYVMSCNLSGITADKDNPYFIAKDDALYNKDMTKLILFPQKREGDFIMPDGVSAADKGVFGGADKMSSLVVDKDTVLSFQGCTSLRKIVYREGIKRLAICGDSSINIKEIYLPSSLVYITGYGFDKNTIFYGYENTGNYQYYEDNIDSIMSYITWRGWGFKSLGAAPGSVKGASAVLDGQHLKVSWKKLKGADGYKVTWYGPGEYSGDYMEFAKDINRNNKTSCTIDIADLYGEREIYVNAYKNINGIHVCGRAQKIDITKFFKYNQPEDAGIEPEIYVNLLDGVNGQGKLYIDRNITTIGNEDVLQDVNAGITEIEVSPENRYFSSVDGVLYNKNKTLLIYYPKLKEGDSFTIPGSVESISKQAFFDNKYLKNIIIGGNVKDIGYLAFGRSNIVEAFIPGTVVTMGSSLFSKCSQLKKVEWDGIKDIPDFMFEGCKSLEDFEIPGVVETIGYGAFSECDRIEVKIGRNVNNIENYAFGKSAKSFLIDEKNQDFKVVDGVLYSIDGKELIAYPFNKEGYYVMPAEVEGFNNEVFSGNKCLTGLTLNGNIEEFDLFYLYGCDNFGKLVLSENTKKLVVNPEDSLNLGGDIDNTGLSFYIKNFREIEVPEGNKYFKIYDGNLYSAGYKTLYYIWANGRKKVVINEACEEISCRYGENEIEEIEVPNSNKSFASVNGVLYDKNITKIILFPGRAKSYNVPATVKDISAIKKWYSSKKRGFTKYKIMACGLQEITVDKNNPYFTAKDNVLYNKDMTKIVLFPQMREGAYIMPDSAFIENIAVFAEASKLSHLKISNDCTLYTGGCTSLKEIICKEGVKEFVIKDKSNYVMEEGFYEKLVIQKIVLPSTIKRMGIESWKMDKNIIFYGYDNTCERFTDISNSLVLKYINDVKTYVKDRGFKYKSLGAAPKTVKSGKVVKKKDKVNVSWKSLKKADGYKVTYKPDAKKPLEEITLKNIKGGKKTSCSFNKSKLKGKKKVYISAYKNINGLKVYGKSVAVDV